MRWKFLFGSSLFCCVFMNASCKIVFDVDFDPRGGDGTGTNAPISPLPSAENDVGDGAPGTQEQQARAIEAEAFIANDTYHGMQVERSVRGTSGKVYDYLRLPASNEPVPDFLGLVPNTSIPGVSLGMTEIENHPEWWGPTGTTVFVRPDFSKYIMDPGGATSIQDWIDNYQVPGIPDDPNRLYAGLNIVQPNVGIYARVNAFKPEVEKGTFSVIELVAVCPNVGPPQEMVGILIGMDWKNYDQPPTLDLSVERWRWVNGVREGGYNKKGSGFVEQFMRPTDVGAPLEYVSTPGGEQWEHALLVIMAPDGTWWVSYNYQILGKFPASVFMTLNKGACRAQIYGEVYNPHPEQGWPRTEMGSGKYGSGLSGDVAWVREIRYFDNSVSFVNEPKSDDLANWSKPYYPPCYDRSSLISQGSAGPIMYLGGPGGKDSLCAQKKPTP